MIINNDFAQTSHVNAHALLSGTNEWFELLDAGAQVSTIFDFSKAFDLVPHKGVLEKLKDSGLYGFLLNLIADDYRKKDC